MASFWLRRLQRCRATVGCRHRPNIGGPLQAHEGWALSLAFNPDGAILASGGTEGLIRLWQSTDASAGETELKPRGAPLSGHENWVSWLFFNPDGQSLVSTSSDGHRFWDVAEGAQLGEPLVGHEAQVWSAPLTRPQMAGAGNAGRAAAACYAGMFPAVSFEAYPWSPVETEIMAISPDGCSRLIGSFDANGVLPAGGWIHDPGPSALAARPIAIRTKPNRRDSMRDQAIPQGMFLTQPIYRTGDKGQGNKGQGQRTGDKVMLSHVILSSVTRLTRSSLLLPGDHGS